MRTQAAAVLVVCAGSVASAQESQLVNEVSSDGGNTWSTSASVLPGATVQVRVRCRLIYTGSVLGCAGVTFQPVLNGWASAAGDVRNPFTFPGLGSLPGPDVGLPTSETAYDGRHVANAPANTGRIFPFGASGQGQVSSSGLITSFNDPGNVLRFAGSRNTTPTTNMVWGVASSQREANSYGTYFSTARTVTLFKYSVTLSPTLENRTLTADVPLSIASSEDCAWFLNTSGSSALRATLIPSATAVITVVPSPGAACALACLCVASLARRRR